MSSQPSDETRLQLLNEAQPGRPWRSCSEKRRCIACERTFRGTSVTVSALKNGATRLGCPRCGSAPELWVRLGNPFVDEQVWADWERALERSAAELADKDESMAVHERAK